MEVTREEKIEQLERVLQGQSLHGSESLRAFLRYVGLKAIDGQEQQLKEYVIATEVFGRGSDYDSRVDSVVRVQAGRLRTRLQEYYASEGRHDKVLIELPKGHYAPAFSYLGENHDIASGAVRNGDSEYLTRTAQQRHAVAPLWGELLRQTEPVLVVFSNTVFHGTYEDGMKLYNSLNALASRDGSPAFAATANRQTSQPMIDHYTGIGEVMGVYFLGDFFARLHQPYRLKRSLLLTWDDAKTENIVVLGSPAENLFLLDLPQQQDFTFCWLRDEQGHHVNAIVNTSPQPGEQECYLARQYGPSPSQISEDYAVVSLLQGLSENTRLLILAGINTFGTQAAAEYVTRPEYIKDLISHLNTAPPGEPPHLPRFYQVLIRVKVNGSVPVQVSYVTHHVL
jgi:hypothetical protein